MIWLKMCGVPAVVDVASILSLELVGFLTKKFGDLVRSFPSWNEVCNEISQHLQLEDSTQLESDIILTKFHNPFGECSREFRLM